MEIKPPKDEYLIQEYKKNKDNFYLDKLITRYLPLIKSMLTIYKIPKQDYDDSYQELMVIFIKLVKQYKEGEVDFRGYIKNKLKKRYYHYIRKHY